MEKLNHLQQSLASLYIDAFLVTDHYNIKYLTGFDLMQGDGFLLVTEETAIMVTDARYQQALADFDGGDDLVGLISADYWGSLDELCIKLDLSVLGFEDSIKYDLYDQLDYLMHADLVPFHQQIENMRELKDQTEIAKIADAASLADQGFAYVLQTVHPGMSERSLANQLDFWMKEHGASAASFPTIVASGPNGAKPHAQASNRLMEKGDLVTLDFGYYVDGYTADMTRTLALGQPDQRLLDLYGLVNDARQAVIEAIRPGITGDALDAAGRKLIEQVGLGQYFPHGMGHGIGLEVHELPLSYGPASKKLKLLTNEVITVEPGIYLPGVAGIRIEDDLVVEHGEARLLTNSPHDLVIVE